MYPSLLRKNRLSFGLGRQSIPYLSSQFLNYSKGYQFWVGPIAKEVLRDTSGYDVNCSTVLAWWPMGFNQLKCLQQLCMFYGIICNPIRISSQILKGLKQSYALFTNNYSLFEKNLGWILHPDHRTSDLWPKLLSWTGCYLNH